MGMADVRPSIKGEIYKAQKLMESGSAMDYQRKTTTLIVIDKDDAVWLLELFERIKRELFRHESVYEQDVSHYKAEAKRLGWLWREAQAFYPALSRLEFLYDDEVCDLDDVMQDVIA